MAHAVGHSHRERNFFTYNKVYGRAHFNGHVFDPEFLSNSIPFVDDIDDGIGTHTWIGSSGYNAGFEADSREPPGINFIIITTFEIRKF